MLTNIGIHILCTFTEELTRRICLTIKSFFGWWSFPLFSWHRCVIQWWYCKEELDAYHSWGLKSQSNKHCPYLWPVLLRLPPEPLKPNCWREFNLLGLQRKYAVRSSGYKSNWIGLQTRKTLHDRESQQK